MLVKFLVTVLVSCTLFAESKWTKVESPNFTLYTLDGEKEARRAAQQFEEAHLFFESIWRKLDRDKPIRIISFNASNKAYEQMTTLKKSGAFYLGAADADYIVMRDLSAQSFPIAVHEYMHLVVRHAGLKVPAWLNEGLSEVYSTITERREKGRDQVLIGDLPPTHLPFLNGTVMYRLPELLAVDHKSKIYTGGDKDTHRFYAQSWALTHMLMLHKDYSPHFNKILSAAEKEIVTPEHVEAATGKSLEVIEKDLEKYIRQSMYRGFLYDTKLKGKETAIRLGTLEAGEEDLLLSGMKVYREDWKDFAAPLETVAGQYPKSAFAFERLAILAQRQANREKEEAALQQALQLGSTSPYLVMRYARMNYADDKSLPLAAASLQRTLDAYPDHVDVRIELSLALGRWKRPIQAYAITVPVARITPQKASRLFYARAYARYGSKEFDEALAEAVKAKKYAIEDYDVRNAESLVQSIESYQAAVARYKEAEQSQGALTPDAEKVIADVNRPRLRDAVRESSGAEASDAEERPTLRRVAEEVHREVVTRPVEATLEESVTFEAFDCESRIFTLKTAAGKLMRLYLEDPQKLEVRGTGTVTVDLTCGPQRQQKLQVTFAPKEDAARKTVGSLRRLHFLSAY